MAVRKTLTALAALLCVAASPAKDPANPTCPAKPDMGAGSAMTFTVQEMDGYKVLLAEGVIDQIADARLGKVLDANPDVAEIWFRSAGGNAAAGNAAGRLLRTEFPGIVTRIPAGWACFSACNFVFMGGQLRVVEPGGQFMVHMFTHTSDRGAIRQEVQGGVDNTVELIGEIEQSSALLASDDNDFLIRMGVSRKLLTEVMYQQQAVASDRDPSTRYCLSQDEVYKYNVANVRE